MDLRKVGRLIHDLRIEKDMTQKQLADSVNVSDKTVSKWERGLGCPDVTLLTGLSLILETDIQKLLEGDLKQNKSDPGNMRRIKFYVCPNCGNIINNIGKGDVSCCGRILKPLLAKKPDKSHELKTVQIENDYYITAEHEMTKGHYVSFAAYVSSDRMLLIKLYPEQNAEIRFPKTAGGKLYYYCSKHGLFINN